MPAFLQQNVNQYLCITLIALMCVWTVLYYLSNKAQAIGNRVMGDASAIDFDAIDNIDSEDYSE